MPPIDSIAPDKEPEDVKVPGAGPARSLGVLKWQRTVYAADTASTPAWVDMAVPGDTGLQPDFATAADAKRWLREQKPDDGRYRLIRDVECVTVKSETVRQLSFLEG